MILTKKLMVTGLVTALLSLNSCGDRATPKIEGQVMYSDAVLYGLTVDANLNGNDRYNITNREGNIIGSMDLNGNVYDNTNKQIGTSPCAGTTDNAYNENGFLVGTCSLDITSTAAVDGLSAYDIAVRNGFIGTEAQWLETLKGEGKDGTSGTDGTDGTDGDTAPTSLCSLGNTSPACVFNNSDYKLAAINFHEKGILTDTYQRGGQDHYNFFQAQGSGSIEWLVWNHNAGHQVPSYYFKNAWFNGVFTSTDPDLLDPAPAQKPILMYSDNGSLVLENKTTGDLATLTISSNGTITIINSGYTIEHIQDDKRICFTTEFATECLTYTLNLSYIGA